MDEKTTHDLMEVLKNTDSLNDYLEEIKDYENPGSFISYFNSLEKVKEKKKSEIIKNSGLDRNYAYQILSGEKNPSRDKVIALCFGAELSVKESQRALQYAGENVLYPKDKRDAVIIFALNSNLSLLDTQTLLLDLSLNPVEV